ncbi:MAG: YacP-like NYN domain protein [bacterium ADurb.Bin243]|nr:MAG: YacP-like NYN domain protein [bacterium ADurb.Bin243]HOD40535.1 NYN domain-containing protein [Candidatus Wallbacteria bacterium]
MAIAKPLVIIDGCNAINLMKSFSRDAKGTFQSDCSKLISLIQNYSYQASRRFIIVFDGYNPNGRNQNFGDNVSVVFSGKKIADLVIEKMTLERNAKLIEVVTSDNEVASICRNHGAKVMKVQDFEKQIEFYGEQMNAHLIKQKGGRVSEAENPLSENLDEGSSKKLNDLAVELQKREMAAKARGEELAAKERELKKKQSKEAAAKKAKTTITDDDASLFTEMFADAKKVVSKKYGGETAAKKEKPGPDDKNRKNETAKDPQKPLKSTSPEKFDWTKHIDESFKNNKKH